MIDNESRGLSPTSPENVSPRDTGATGSQGTSAESTAVTSAPVVGSMPVDADHLGAVLGDHIQAASPTTMAFAVAAFRDAYASRELLRNQLDRSSNDRDAAHERYHEEAKKAAVLEARLESTNRFKRFQSWAFGLGGVIAGAGLGSAVQSGSMTWPYGLLMICGATVMWIGAPLSNREN